MGRRVVGRSWLILGLALACLPTSAGQRGPVSHVAGAQAPLADVEIWRAPAFDYRAAAAEPITKGQALQVGRRFPVDVTTSNAGNWETTSLGDRLWRMRFASSGALWIVLGLDRFELPPGATLYLVGQDGKHLQTYTTDDVQPHGQLWTAPAPGDEIVLELHWPSDLSRQDSGIHLAYVSHGYRPFGAVGRAGTDKGLGDSGSCNIDVVCPQGDDWRDEIRGTVLILEGGFAACSASLINNTAQDCSNYVLTANHCFTAGDAASLTFQFNFDRPSCGSGTPGPAQIVTGGATFRAAAAGSDFYLAEMLGDIPTAFDPYYSGWSRSTAAASGSTTIHHPSGDAKKISFNTDPLVSNGSLWRVTEWEEGTTEPGSSGSPMFDQNHLIVGQLFGGFASCSLPDEWDEYGKFSVSWTGNGTSSSRLSDWLDPAGSGILTLPGIDHQACGATSLVSLQESRIDDATAGNGDGIVDSGESIVLTVDAVNNGGVDATEVFGTLTTSTPGVSIPIPTASFPDIAAGTFETSLSPHFQIVTAPEFECGTPIELNLSLVAAEASFPTENPITLATGTENVTIEFADDLEQGGTNWTTESPDGTSPWALTTADSNSPTTSWFVPDTEALNDQILQLDTFADLAPGSELSFQHRFNTENGFDGGVLEVQVNGGSWQDAAASISQGGYNGAISNQFSSPIGGRSAWTGSNGGFSEVLVDLSSWAGGNVGVRWRLGTDISLSGEGWYVDDVQLREVTNTCTPVVPGEAAGPDSSALFTIQHSVGTGTFTLEWSEPATGAPPTGYRLYATPLGGPLALTCEADLGLSTSVLLTDLSDNCGFLIVAVNASGEGSYGTDSTGAEREKATGVDVCP